MKSGHVRSQDWHALFRLAGDLADVPAGGVEGRVQQFMQQLFQIIGARGGLWSSSTRTLSGEAAAGDPLCGWRPVHYFLFDPCPDDYEMRQRWAPHAATFMRDSYVQAALRGHGRHRVLLRPQLVDGPTWERSILLNEVLRPLGIYDLMTAAWNFAPALEVFVCLDRNAGERPFNVREREVLRAAMEGLGWFHRRVLNELKLIDAAQTLTPREQQILPLLRNGRLEKQIAHELGLTVSTAHFYVASIYRKLQVHSRAELMSLWAPGSKQTASGAERRAEGVVQE